jgi:hypothetical protein
MILPYFTEYGGSPARTKKPCSPAEPISLRFNVPGMRGCAGQQTGSERHLGQSWTALVMSVFQSHGWCVVVIGTATFWTITFRSRSFYIFLPLIKLSNLLPTCLWRLPPSQWSFQEPKLEVPTIYKAYVRPMYLNFREYPHKIWPEIWYVYVPPF